MAVRACRIGRFGPSGQPGGELVVPRLQLLEQTVAQSCRGHCPINIKFEIKRRLNQIRFVHYAHHHVAGFVVRCDSGQYRKGIHMLREDPPFMRIGEKSPPHIPICTAKSLPKRTANLLVLRGYCCVAECSFHLCGITQSQQIDRILIG